MPNKQERRSTKRIDCYNRSILNNEIEHSLVVDVNTDGAGLLLLKDQSLFKDFEADGRPIITGDVHLTVFHPDILKDGISIDANVVWVDYDFSDDYHKIGVCFDNMNKAEVDKLIDCLSKQCSYYFHCELEKR